MVYKPNKKQEVKAEPVVKVGNKNKKIVSSNTYKELMSQYKGQTLTVGSSFNNPQVGTLEYWLQSNVTKVSISTYVASILEHQKVAVRVNKKQLKFNA